MVSDVQSPPVRIIIVDDNPLVLDGVDLVIRATPGCVCVGRLPNADGLIEAVVKARPDLVLLDFDLPGGNVVEAIEEICRYRQHPVRIIILSGTGERWAIETSLNAGARGYVIKLDGISAIRRAIRDVMGGKVSLSPAAAEALHRSPSFNH
jgi:DNA-binding NarL/FixJ family response regulator